MVLYINYIISTYTIMYIVFHIYERTECRAGKVAHAVIPSPEVLTQEDDYT